MLDFNRSTISWDSANGSIGEFAISSVFIDKTTLECTYLSCPVLAGDVYSKNLIPRLPSYHFLWATNGNNKIIYRLSAADNVTVDKYKLVKNETIIVNNKYIYYNNLDLKEMFNNRFALTSLIICRLEIDNSILEFPVRHINIHPEKCLFHVETGPILFLIREKLVPVFIYFNRVNKCQVVQYYPLLTNKYLTIKCKISFFISAPD